MTAISQINKNIIRFGLPMLMIVAMVILGQSSVFKNNPDSLSIGITIDLLLTIPLVYFLLIRKTNIPKTTVVPLIIIGLIIGSYLLPEGQQKYLTLFKTWLLPIIELVVLGFILFKIREVLKQYKKAKENTLDFFDALKATCKLLLPKIAVIPVTTEIAVFYYGFIYWKKRVLKETEFSYHKNSGSVTLLVALILIIAIETVTLHYLLLKWSEIAAWILTGLSIYSGFQFFGFLKSLSKRPFIIDKDTLLLRYGIMSETTINVDNIEAINLTTKDIELTDEVRKLSILGDLESHNMTITLKTEGTIMGLYGFKKSYKTLVFFVDRPSLFKTKIEEAQEFLINKA